MLNFFVRWEGIFVPRTAMLRGRISFPSLKKEKPDSRVCEATRAWGVFKLKSKDKSSNTESKL